MMDTLPLQVLPGHPKDYERFLKPGEVWTDELIDWKPGEEHIGKVTINMVLNKIISYIKVDQSMGSMTTEDFLHWFFPMHYTNQRYLYSPK